MEPSWLHRPQQVGLRRALFQVHLWVSLVLGLYILVISISGSAVVLRREYNQWLVPQSVPSTAGVRLQDEALRAAVAKAYPQQVVAYIGEPRRPDRPVTIRLDQDGKPHVRLFDPYAAKDMGPATPLSMQVAEWLVDLHDNLLAGKTGRIVNGVGALSLLLVLLTGMVLWWPGKARWWQGLVLHGPVNSLRFVRQLHSFLGFWSLALLLLWVITAAYFAFPQTFEWLIDYFDPNLEDALRPGEQLLYDSVNLHFGRFSGMKVRIAWIVLGLVPALLFITGFITWWKRQRQTAKRTRGTRAATAA